MSLITNLLIQGRLLLGGNPNSGAVVITPLNYKMIYKNLQFLIKDFTLGMIKLKLLPYYVHTKIMEVMD